MGRRVPRMYLIDSTGQNMSKQNVVIVGGGFAGVTLARRPERTLPKSWDIFLLSKTNLVTYSPLLPEVVGASVLPGHAVAPLRRILKRTRMRMVTVNGIDTTKQTVSYSTPAEGTLKYDHLVMTCGVDANVSLIEGMSEHGLPLKNLGDALYLRNRVISSLEQATIIEDIQRKRWLSRVVVVGGGFSGVEVAGEIQDLLIDAVPLFKRVKPEDCFVELLHGSDCLLPELSQSLGRYTERLMRKRGIKVRLNSRVACVDERGVQLNDGTRVDGATVVCTIGTRPQGFVAALPLADSRGRLPTNQYMQVTSTSNIWAIGDCASVPNGGEGKPPCPPTAQCAIRQASALAANLLRAVRNQPLKSFRYRAIGQLAAVGHRKAVAEIGGFRVSGIIAWLLWRGFYLSKIPTLARKVRLFLEWNWAIFFPKDIALLDFERSLKNQPDGTTTPITSYTQPFP